MNEPKKRGRPSKAEIAARELAKPRVDLTAEAMSGIGPEDFDRPPFRSDVAAAQAYALRIWAKQSISLSRHERVGRIAAALKEQGLSMEGVELP